MDKFRKDILRDVQQLLQRQPARQGLRLGPSATDRLADAPTKQRDIEKSWSTKPRYNSTIVLGGKAATICGLFNWNNCEYSSTRCKRHHACGDCHTPELRQGHAGCSKAAVPRDEQ